MMKTNYGKKSFFLSTRKKSKNIDILVKKSGQNAGPVRISLVPGPILTDGRSGRRTGQISCFGCYFAKNNTGLSEDPGLPGFSPKTTRVFRVFSFKKLCYNLIRVIPYHFFKLSIQKACFFK